MPCLAWIAPYMSMFRRRQKEPSSNEVIVIRDFSLPVSEFNITSNTQKVAEVAANGGVQGIHWVTSPAQPSPPQSPVEPCDVPAQYPEDH